MTTKDRFLLGPATMLPRFISRSPDCPTCEGQCCGCGARGALSNRAGAAVPAGAERWHQAFKDLAARLCDGKTRREVEILVNRNRALPNLRAALEGVLANRTH